MVIVNSALKGNGDCFSDILTVLVWSTGCVAGDGGDCSDRELSSDRDGRVDAQNSAWSLGHAHSAAHCCCGGEWYVRLSCHSTVCVCVCMCVCRCLCVCV